MGRNVTCNNFLVDSSQFATGNTSIDSHRLHDTNASITASEQQQQLTGASVSDVPLPSCCKAWSTVTYTPMNRTQTTVL